LDYRIDVTVCELKKRNKLGQGDRVGGRERRRESKVAVEVRWLQSMERRRRRGVEETGFRIRDADSPLHVGDDLDEGDGSGRGLKDHGSPLVGGAVITSPFGLFQSRKETWYGKQERYEHQGVGGSDVHRRWTPRSEATRSRHTGWRGFLHADGEVDE
jgi:hypothetical protein